MSWWEALILGLVQGITEYLPVSSTGHLLVVQAMLGIGQSSAQAKEAADAYAICIQAGAIVAVLGLYYRRVIQMARGLLGHDPDGRRLAINILVAFTPAVVLGLAFNEPIERYLFHPWPVVGAWFVGGVAILAVAWYRKARGEGPKYGGEIMSLTWKLALVIGLAQCLAMWPGTSRSLVTIVGGVLVGLSLPAAVEFSFLLGVLTLGGATCKKALENGPEMINQYPPLAIIIGFLAAWVSAVLAVKWMVAYLNKHGMQIFGYYRIAIAILVGAMLLTGSLTIHTG